MMVLMAKRLTGVQRRVRQLVRELQRADRQGRIRGLSCAQEFEHCYLHHRPVCVGSRIYIKIDLAPSVRRPRRRRA